MAVQFYEPTLNPHVPQMLCSSVLVDTSISTVQNVAQLVGGGILNAALAPSAPTPALPQLFVLTGVYVRPIGVAPGASITVSLSWSATASAAGGTLLLTTATTLQSAPLNGVQQLLGANAVQATLGQPGQYLNISFPTAGAANSKAMIDVTGYFVAA